MVVVVGGRKGFPQEVLGSHVTASDLERLMSEKEDTVTITSSALTTTKPEPQAAVRTLPHCQW
jgi:hypothetical protein